MNLTVIRLCTHRNVLIAMDSIIQQLPTSLLTIIFVVIAIASGSLHGSEVYAQEITQPFLTSGMIATQQRLQAPCDQSLQGPLELVVSTLSQSYELPIWIDREIPRDQVIDVSAPKGKLETCLQLISQKVGGEIVLVEGAVLLVPSDIADAINTSYWTWKTSSPPSTWGRTETMPFEWKIGTEMAEVARMLCLRYKLKDAWVQDLEHDVWPASTFQKIPSHSIATCVLSSMRMQLRWDGGKVSVESLRTQPSAHPVEWNYTAAQIEKLGNEHCRLWKTQTPEAKIEKKGNQWLIQANATSHRKLIAPLVPLKKWAPPSKDNAVYSGVLQGSLGYAVDALAKAMAIEIGPLPLPEKVAQREIRVEYKNASIDKILQDLGVAGKVEFRKQANRYEIIILN